MQVLSPTRVNSIKLHLRRTYEWPSLYSRKFKSPLNEYKTPQLCNVVPENGYSQLVAADVEVISEDVLTYYPKCPGLKREILDSTSFAFEKPLSPKHGENSETVQLPHSWFRPEFKYNEVDFCVRIPVEEGTCFYGAGERPGPLLLNGQRIITWNTDNPQYDVFSERIYQSHPYILAVPPRGESSYGVVFDTSYRLFISLHEGCIEVKSDKSVKGKCPPFRVVSIFKKSPKDVVRRLGDLTGLMSLPPKWSIGYHQCRYSYYPDDTARELARNFRSRNIPCDVIWFDIHYMDGFRIFTFDPQSFPNPKRLNSELHNQGFHTVWMIDPGVKKEDGYFVHDQMKERDLAVKQEDKVSNFVGDVWPGPCLFPDFTMKETQEWWASLYPKFVNDNGIDGVWNDMNEPAVFTTAVHSEYNFDAKTMPSTNYHRGYGGGHHDKFHNLYGMLMIKSSREGMMKAKPEKRPFILSRANYLGGQRYGATWTGDNTSDWDHLHMSISMVLNLGLSAQPFAGPDIGGFEGNADRHLFARWMGFGALLPFARGHSDVGSVDHEPWSFGPETESTCRIAINRRYMLMSYLYTLFYRASTTGEPIAMPLFFADPTDIRLRAEDRVFILGDDLMVIVNTDDPTPSPSSCTISVENCDNEEDYHSIPLPTNESWYILSIDDHLMNSDLPLLKIRSGSIIPTIPVMQFVDQSKTTSHTITLHIALNETGFAQGIFYNDEGDGYKYKSGYYSLTKYSVQLKESLSSSQPRSGLEISIQVEGNVDLSPVSHGIPLSIHLILGNANLDSPSTSSFSRKDWNNIDKIRQQRQREYHFVAKHFIGTQVVEFSL
eukprot:TRINITY_DN12065_c0_g1_i1.p1 TRINITY_DN12065_c0_g1~~TRINITY_DN12065_c0_g1_i1.p1  ORF type:complete len:831 (+),score=75.39 TRINITY_DN12065_c0_g1_i1:184-2676(+)